MSQTNTSLDGKSQALLRWLPLGVILIAIRFLPDRTPTPIIGYEFLAFLAAACSLPFFV